MHVTTGRSPRLRTGHLLVGIVGCAVGFAAYRSIAPSPRMVAHSGRAMAIITGYSLAMGTAFGSILTGCALMAGRRWRGDVGYPSRPGHWLLAFALASAAADVAAVVAFNRQAAREPAIPVTALLAQFMPGPEGFSPALHHHAVGWGVGAIIALGFLRALRRRLERRWVAVFLVFSIAGATLAAAHITCLILSQYPVRTRPLADLIVHAYAVAVIVGAAAIVAATLGDRRAGASGDGLHRLGVGAWLAIAAIQVLMYAIYLAG